MSKNTFNEDGFVTLSKSHKSRKAAIGAEVWVSCYTDKSKEAKGCRSYIWNARFSAAVVNQAGWKIGDRIDIDYNADKNQVLFKKVLLGGWCLSGAKKEQHGSVRSGGLNLVHRKPLPWVEGNHVIDIYVVKKERVFCQIPDMLSEDQTEDTVERGFAELDARLNGRAN